MDELTPHWRRRFRSRLRTWYRQHRRSLPWRTSRDPYRVWVSEIMLQQTQVATVRDYFTRFVQRFPTVEALAAGTEEDVLRSWEGLGYYRRARQMHAAAREIVITHGGRFPRNVQGLQRLPGIGRYTAGAIASIAFDSPAPILEANTQRLYARLSGYLEPPGTAKGQRELWSVAESLVPRRGAGEFNQALMELGSLVCTPRGPQCGQCPVATLCRAHREGQVDMIPPPKPRPIYEAVHEAAVVISGHGKILLRQCGHAERWAGLWDFPRVVLGSKTENGNQLQDEVSRRVAEVYGETIVIEEHLATIKHGVTRFRITLDCFAAKPVSERRAPTSGRKLQWVPRRQLAELPLNTTGRKIAQLVHERGE